MTFWFLIVILVKNISMTIKELKEWLNKLPEELYEYDLVIREIKEVEEGKIGQRDVPVISAFVDKNASRLALIDPESNEVVRKIRENAAKENKIEGSDLSDVEKTTDNI